MQFYPTKMNLCRLNALTDSPCAEEQREQGKKTSRIICLSNPSLHSTAQKSTLFLRHKIQIHRARASAIQASPNETEMCCPNVIQNRLRSRMMNSRMP